MKIPLKKSEFPEYPLPQEYNRQIFSGQNQGIMFQMFQTLLTHVLANTMQKTGSCTVFLSAEPGPMLQML